MTCANFNHIFLLLVSRNGSKLLNFAIGALKSEGISRIHCLVKQDNLIAQQFWEACGFELRDELYDFSLKQSQPLLYFATS